MPVIADRIENPNPQNDRMDAPPRRRATPPYAADDGTALRAHFAVQRARCKVLHTTRLPSGQVVDWIDARSQVASRKIAKPPVSTPLPYESGARRKERLVGFELEQADAVLGPVGSVPVLRKDLDALPTGKSLQDYLSKHGAPLHTVRDLSGGSIELPQDGSHHGYAATAQFVNCFGGEGFLSAYDPYVQWPDEFSLEQVLLGASNQTLEAGWQVYYQMYHDWKPHLFIFYTTNGYTKQGDNLGGYNRDVQGWVQVSRTVFPGAAFTPSSAIGGTQFAIFIKYQRFAGNWWLKVGNEWVGYYPAALFSNLGLRNSADAIKFYGEIVDAPLPLGRTRTDMGSGRFAATRWGNAGYAHNLRFQSNGSGGMANYDSTGGNEFASDPTLYTLETHMKSGTSWGSYFWFGGPGAVPNANCPKLMRAIDAAEAKIRELQDQLKGAGPTQKGGIGAKIKQQRRELEAAQDAARKNFCI